MAGWWRTHLRVRISTVVLCVLFVIILLLYFTVRPTPSHDPAPRSTPHPSTSAATGG